MGAAPAGALGGILKDDAGGGEFIADFIRAGVVFVRPSLDALLDQRIDVGVEQGFLVGDDADDRVGLGEERLDGVLVGLTDDAAFHRDVDLAHQLEDLAHRAGNVEIVIHAGFEFAEDSLGLCGEVGRLGGVGSQIVDAVDEIPETADGLRALLETVESEVVLAAVMGREVLMADRGRLNAALDEIAERVVVAHRL